MIAAIRREIRHWREWRAVLEAEAKEGQKVSFWKMVRARLSGKASRQLWRRRMRVCVRCPIYNRKLRQCRRDKLGCGCYTLFTATAWRPYAKGCWGRTFIGAPFGWD